MSKCSVQAVLNQKGGTGKTTTSINMGAALSLMGKKVLLVDADPQGNLTTALGWQKDALKVTLHTHMEKIIEDQSFPPRTGILRHEEGFDVMPANISLSGTELGLVYAMNRERIMKLWLDQVKDAYDHVLIDCNSSLGMITINALVAANSVIVPVQAQYLAADGMTQLITTVSRVKRQINPDLEISGLLLTLYDTRTNLAKQVERKIRTDFGENLRVFRAVVPTAVSAAEASAYGQSIFSYDEAGKVAAAYAAVAKEVTRDATRKRAAPKPDFVR